MNKLKKLFSPSSLAATLATGMLLGSGAVALAGVYSVLAYQTPQQCGSSTSCHDPYTGRYWCCQSGSHSCVYPATYAGGVWYGWCDDNSGAPPP